jgi:hypothetical protein
MGIRHERWKTCAWFWWSTRIAPKSGLSILWTKFDTLKWPSSFFKNIQDIFNP